MSNRTSTPRTVLGLYVTPQTIEAALLRPAGNYAQLLHRTSRPRLRMGETVKADDYASVLPGMKSSDDVDFTLEVGDGGGSAVDVTDPSLSSTGDGPSLFMAQLRDILDECKARGYEDPDVAVCVGAPDVATVEVALSAQDLEGNDGLSGLVDRVTSLTSGQTAQDRALQGALKAAYNAPFDAKRVAFTPMTPGADGERFLAHVPTAREAVTPTINALAANDRFVSARLLESEVALSLYYVRHHLQPASESTTAVVRVSSEDTVVAFLRGTELLHVDRLRSLTSFDPAEMICSRVMLHQDEAKIDDVDTVVLIGGPRDARLQDGFTSFYPKADVLRLHDVLHAETVDVAADVDDALTPGTGPAMLAALRQIAVNKGEPSPTNLFPASLQQPRRTPRLGFAWHTALMLLLLTGASLYFTWQFMEGQQEIAARERVLSMSPEEMPELTPQALKARVDSLNAVHARYNRALHVLDSLLVGSDEWSRAIERTATQTDAIDGLWFDNWNVDPSTITIQGHALERANLARLARELDGIVEELQFADIEGARVYPFTVRIDRHLEMPEVAKKLREDALDAGAPTTASAAPVRSGS